MGLDLKLEHEEGLHKFWILLNNFNHYNSKKIKFKLWPLDIARP